VLIVFLYLFSVLVVLGTSQAASVSAWLVDSSEGLLSCTQQDFMLIAKLIELILRSICHLHQITTPSSRNHTIFRQGFELT